MGGQTVFHVRGGVAVCFMLAIAILRLFEFGIRLGLHCGLDFVMSKCDSGTLMSYGSWAIYTLILGVLRFSGSA